MKVRSGPWQGEPVGKDNCNIVRCCGKAVLAKVMARGTRTALGFDVWTSLPAKAKSYTCPEDIWVYAAGVWRRSPHLPREVCICDMMSMLSGNGQQMHIQKSAEVIVAARDAAVKDRTECEVLHLESLEEYYRRRAVETLHRQLPFRRWWPEVIHSRNGAGYFSSAPQCMTETRTGHCWKDSVS